MPGNVRMLRAVVVDDEAPGRDALRTALAKIGNVQVVAEASNGRDAIGVIRAEKPDVVFLDVQMPEVDGFGVIFGVGAGTMPPVVMVTAHDRFAVKAFEVNAVDYLLKPYARARLDAAVQRVRALLERGPEALAEHRATLSSLMQDALGADGADGSAALATAHGFATRLLVKKGDHIRFVAVDAVDYFHADANYVELHVGKDTHRVRRTLKDILAQLDPRRFVRVHRSTVLNLERIKEVQPWFNGDYVALLTTGEQLRVSRVYRDGLLRPQF